MLRDLVVLRVAPDAAGLVEGSDAEIDELRQLASRNEVGRLRRMFRALIQEQEDLTWAPQPFAVIEMAVVRLATLAGGEDVQALLQRLDALERRLSGSAPPDPGPSSAPPRPRSGGGASAPRSGGTSSRPAPSPSAAPTATLAAPIEEPLDATPEAKAHASGADAPRAASHRRAEPIGTARWEPTDRESSGSTPDESPPPRDSDYPSRRKQQKKTSRPRTTTTRRISHRKHALPRLARPPPRPRHRARSHARRRARRRGAARAYRQGAAHPRAAGLRRASGGAAATRPRSGVRAARGPSAAHRSGRPEAGARGEVATGGGDETVRRRRRDALAHPAVNTVLEILGGEVVEIRPQGGAPR